MSVYVYNQNCVSFGVARGDEVELEANPDVRIYGETEEDAVELARIYLAQGPGTNANQMYHWRLARAVLEYCGVETD